MKLKIVYEVCIINNWQKEGKVSSRSSTAEFIERKGLHENGTGNQQKYRHISYYSLISRIPDNGKYSQVVASSGRNSRSRSG